MIGQPARAPRAGRAVLALIALTFAGAIAIELHWTRVGDEAGRSGTGSSRGDAVRAARGFERAASHTPGTEALVGEGEMYLFHGDMRGAARALARATAREPRNALAWALLSRAESSLDPAGSLLAHQRAAALNPRLGR